MTSLDCLQHCTSYIHLNLKCAFHIEFQSPHYHHHHSSVVCEWVFELVDKERRKNKEGETKDSSIGANKSTVTESKMTEKKEVTASGKKKGKKDSTENSLKTVSDNDTPREEDKDIVFLREMFPDVRDENLSSIHSQCRGDMDKTIQKLLQLAEQERQEEEKQPVAILHKVKVCYKWNF